MRARLLAVNPELTTEPPLINLLVVDNQGTIVVCGDYWAREVHCDTLEEVRVEDLRKPLRMGAEEPFSLYLSPIREMPSDDLMSASMLQWSRHWWLDFVMDLARRGCPVFLTCQHSKPLRNYPVKYVMGIDFYASNKECRICSQSG